MRSTPLPIVLAASTLALVACAWRDGEPPARVIPDPAGQRATTLLDAADTAIAHGKPEIARAALVSAYGQPTASPDIAYRVARLADSLDDIGTAARAYRRYLSLAPASPVADTVRTRLLTLVSGPLREGRVDVPVEEVATNRDIAERASRGEVEPTVDSSAVAAAKSAPATAKARRHGSRPSHAAPRRHRASASPRRPKRRR